MANEYALNRRGFLTGGAAAALAAPALAESRALTGQQAGRRREARTNYPVMVGSANALPGMQANYAALAEGADPLDVAIEVVKVAEADPEDTSVGLGGLPNEDGVIQLDAACMYGPTHNSGGVACIENILHPSEVARLVLERTDHCLIVGQGAYEFARSHGHPHAELMTERARKIWMEWKETMSDRDDRLVPATEKKTGRAASPASGIERMLACAERDTPHTWGTIHCSALSLRGELACTTTTSGLSWKIPGRVGDSPIIGAGLYCDQDAGSAGSTGRGEASILSNGSFAICELMRQGATPLQAGHEVLRRIVVHVKRQAKWQPALMREDGTPSFNVHFYVLGLGGETAGVALRGDGSYSVADPDGGPRHERVVPLLS